MSDSLIPFNQSEIQRVVGNGQIENFSVSTTKKGYRKLELQVYDPDGHRSFFVLKDKGYMIERREIQIYPFESKLERNKEIFRLYKKEKMTQEFIGKIFGLKQPTIAGIVKNHE